MQFQTVAIICAGSIAPSISAQTLYTFDFESGGSFGAQTELRSVGGFEGVGAIGREIQGSFAYADQKDAPIVLSVSELGVHNTLDIEFSLALIDSWDAERPDRWWAPDFLSVLVDGNEVFRESFTNFTGDVWAPSYSPDNRSAYGNFYGRSSWQDSVYEISLLGVAHENPAATIEIFATGSGYESGGNEPFAIDNVRITALPAPGSIALLGLVGFASRRRR